MGLVIGELLIVVTPHFPNFKNGENFADHEKKKLTNFAFQIFLVSSNIFSSLKANVYDAFVHERRGAGRKSVLFCFF